MTKSRNTCACQSGFRKQHNTATVAMKVINDVVKVLDAMNYCTALFLDLSKAFDTTDQGILRQRLSDIDQTPIVHPFHNLRK